MSVQVPSSASLQEVIVQPQIYESFQYGDGIIRFTQQELETVDSRHRLLSVFWLTIMATTGTLLATQIVWVVMLVALIGSVIALVFSIIWRNNLRLNIVLITSVLVALLLVSIFNSVYNFTKWTYLSVPAAIIWIGLTVLSDYRFVVRMFLIVFASQAALLTTKVD